MAIVFGASAFSGVSQLSQAYQLKNLVTPKGDQMDLARSEEGHFDLAGVLSPLGQKPEPTFQDAMLLALNGVNEDQLASSSAIEQMLVDPESIEAHDVTIAMAKANLSLNITRTVLDRVVRAWKDLINTR